MSIINQQTNSRNIQLPRSSNPFIATFQGAVQALGHTVQVMDNLVCGFSEGIAAGKKTLVKGEGISKAVDSYGTVFAERIISNIDKYEKTFCGSVISVEQLARMNLFQALMTNFNPIGHVTTAVIEPWTKLLRDGYCSCYRAVLSLGGENISHQELMKRVDSDPYFRWGLTAFSVAETCVFMMAMGLKNPEHAKTYLVSSGGIGGLTAVGNELQRDGDGNFSIGRVFHNGIEQTAASAGFVCGVRGLIKSQFKRQLVDAFDGVGDLSEATVSLSGHIDNLHDLRDWNQLRKVLGGTLNTLVSTYDCADISLAPKIGLSAEKTNPGQSTFGTDDWAELITPTGFNNPLFGQRRGEEEFVLAGVTPEFDVGYADIGDSRAALNDHRGDISSLDIRASADRKEPAAKKLETNGRDDEITKVTKATLPGIKKATILPPAETTPSTQPTQENQNNIFQLYSETPVPFFNPTLELMISYSLDVSLRKTQGEHQADTYLVHIIDQQGNKSFSCIFEITPQGNGQQVKILQCVFPARESNPFISYFPGIVSALIKKHSPNINSLYLAKSLRDEVMMGFLDLIPRGQFKAEGDYHEKPGFTYSRIQEAPPVKTDPTFTPFSHWRSFFAENFQTLYPVLTLEQVAGIFGVSSQVVRNWYQRDVPLKGIKVPNAYKVAGDKYPSHVRFDELLSFLLNNDLDIIAQRLVKNIPLPETTRTHLSPAKLLLFYWTGNFTPTSVAHFEKAKNSILSNILELMNEPAYNYQDLAKLTGLPYQEIAQSLNHNNRALSYTVPGFSNRLLRHQDYQTIFADRVVSTQGNPPSTKAVLSIPLKNRVGYFTAQEVATLCSVNETTVREWYDQFNISFSTQTDGSKVLLIDLPTIARVISELGYSNLARVLLAHQTEAVETILSTHREIILKSSHLVSFLGISPGRVRGWLRDGFISTAKINKKINSEKGDDIERRIELTEFKRFVREYMPEQLQYLELITPQNFAAVNEFWEREPIINAYDIAKILGTKISTVSLFYRGIDLKDEQFIKLDGISHPRKGTGFAYYDSRLQDFLVFLKSLSDNGNNVDLIIEQLFKDITFLGDFETAVQKLTAFIEFRQKADIKEIIKNLKTNGKKFERNIKLLLADPAFQISEAAKAINHPVKEIRSWTREKLNHFRLPLNSDYSYRFRLSDLIAYVAENEQLDLKKARALVLKRLGH